MDERFLEDYPPMSLEEIEDLRRDLAMMPRDVVPIRRDTVYRLISSLKAKQIS